MKAIVVRQPWATLIALGVKTIETRPAPPNGPMRPDGVRGLPGLPLERGERIAIVAGAATPDISWEGGGYAIASEWVQGQRTDFLYREILSDRHDLPLGAVVCTVTVDDALPIVAERNCVDFHAPPQGMLTVSRPDHPIPTLVRFEWKRNAWSGVPTLYSRNDGLSRQLPLGDFSPGRWGWVLSNPQPPTKRCHRCGGRGYVRWNSWGPNSRCPKGCVDAFPDDPIPCKGRQGVFALPDDIATQLGEA